MCDTLPESEKAYVFAVKGVQVFPKSIKFPKFLQFTHQTRTHFLIYRVGQK